MESAHGPKRRLRWRMTSAFLFLHELRKVVVFSSPVNEHRWHSEGPCNGASMLATGPTKTCQNMTWSVMASGFSKSSDWSTHGLVSNCNEAHSNLFHRQRILLCAVVLGGQEFINLEKKTDEISWRNKLITWGSLNETVIQWVSTIIWYCTPSSTKIRCKTKPNLDLVTRVFSLKVHYADLF